MSQAEPDARVDPAPRWVVLRTAPDQLSAEIWRETLAEQGIPSTLSPADAVSFLGVSPTPCRLLVPASLRDAAEEALGDPQAGDELPGDAPAPEGEPRDA